MKLDVQVLGTTVASLYRESDLYVLKYLPGVAESDFVSLTMPVRDEPWKWPRDLHPFFRQNLPEGFLLEVIREDFSRLLDGTDLSLLAVVGGMGIGRVTVTPEGMAPGREIDPLQIEELLTGENTTARFAALVRQYARAAVSGAVPKFLAPQEPVTEVVGVMGKSTLRTKRFIVKGSVDNTPYLGFNEFHSMRVLERLNVVPTAKTRMSDDGRVLLVERFDVDDNGVPVAGLEDACSLLGLSPHEKYATTLERVLNATRAYLPPESARTQCEQFGWQLLVNYVVRNADYHAKNMALRYTQLSDVAFSPVFDIVTTQAYLRFAGNPPALPAGGRRSWAPGKSLEQFFKARLGINPREYGQMVERLCESALEVGRELAEAARNETRWQDIARRMLHAWDEGISALSGSKKAGKPLSLKSETEAAGFSEPEPPEPPTVIGKSELLS